MMSSIDAKHDRSGTVWRGDCGFKEFCGDPIGLL